VTMYYTVLKHISWGDGECGPLVESVIHRHFKELHNNQLSKNTQNS